MRQAARALTFSGTVMIPLLMSGTVMAGIPSASRPAGCSAFGCGTLSEIDEG